MKEAKGWQKFIGLMFQREPCPLIFRFNKPTKVSIHSFFCKPFLAIYILNKNIVELKVVTPNQSRIESQDEFDTLIEIPCSLLKS